jgi:hypothetical protein
MVMPMLLADYCIYSNYITLAAKTELERFNFRLFPNCRRLIMFMIVNSTLCLPHMGSHYYLVYVTY